MVKQFEVLPVISPYFRLMQEHMLPLQTKTLKAKKGGAQRRSLTTRIDQNSPNVQSASGHVSQHAKQWQFLDSIIPLPTALDMFLSISPKGSATVWKDATPSTARIGEVGNCTGHMAVATRILDTG